MTSDIRLALVMLCLLALSLSACGSALLQDDHGLATPSPAPPNQTTASEPEAVLGAFIDAWGREDYEAMHALLAARSRELYPLQRFINQYTAAHSEIRFSGVRHALRQLRFQGSTAIINYDIEIESPTFGTITDEQRVMRLIQEGGWKIAWSSMDILDGLSSRARLTAGADYPPRANITDRNGKPLAEEGGTVYKLVRDQAGHAEYR